MVHKGNSGGTTVFKKLINFVNTLENDSTKEYYYNYDYLCTVYTTEK